MDVLNGILDLFAPRLCASCGRRLDGHHPVCVHCLTSLPRATRSACESLMLPLLDAAPCRPGVAASWLRYVHDGGGARLIRSIKYGCRPATGRALGRVFGYELLGSTEFAGTGRPGAADVHVLLPVPLYWTKELHRGFNQSREIAVGLAQALGADVSDALVAVRPHGSQTRRSAAGRAANVRGSFALDGASALDGLHVAIVDDVVTTGATVTEAVLALARADAKPASLGILSLGLAGND